MRREAEQEPWASELYTLQITSYTTDPSIGTSDSSGFHPATNGLTWTNFKTTFGLHNHWTLDYLVPSLYIQAQLFFIVLRGVVTFLLSDGNNRDALSQVITYSH